MVMIDNKPDDVFTQQRALCARSPTESNVLGLNPGPRLEPDGSAKQAAQELWQSAISSDHSNAVDRYSSTRPLDMQLRERWELNVPDSKELP